jgi:hypothetical protein
MDLIYEMMDYSGNNFDIIREHMERLKKLNLPVM